MAAPPVESEANAGRFPSSQREVVCAETLRTQEARGAAFCWKAWLLRSPNGQVIALMLRAPAVAKQT
jgi:hypothetical protein